jgi:hypothetical protein
MMFSIFNLQHGRTMNLGISTGESASTVVTPLGRTLLPTI